MTDDAAPAAQDRQPHRGRAFVLGYGAAQMGAFIGFLPLLTILLPLKAEALDPVGKTVLLSHVALWGGLAAALSNVVIGVLSDGTRSRFGRRRPWIVGGVLATAATYGLMLTAASPWALLAAFVLFQLALNTFYGPLNAVLPDMVPDRQKGFVSALMGLGQPAASLFSFVVLTSVLAGASARFSAVVIVMLVLVLPFGLRLREPAPPERVKARASLSLVALRDHDFLIAFGSRLMVQVAITLNMIYLLYFLQTETDVGTRFPGLGAEVVLGWLLAASTGSSLLFGFVGGLLSDRVRRRKIFVALGGLLMSAGAALLVTASAWPGPFVAKMVFGAGLGLYSTVDIALVAQILPSRENAGRDLGLMNVAITVPQIAAPALGIVLVSLADGRLTAIFTAAALFALIGALIVMLIRRSG